MLRLLGYLLNQGVVTARDYCAPLSDGMGLPGFSDNACQGSQCHECRDACPTNAITVNDAESGGEVHLDLGACIACSMCIRGCPEETIVSSKDTSIARFQRNDLVIATREKKQFPSAAGSSRSKGIFARSIACRVVSTGCSACDLEVAACGNSIFDMERYGIHVVASPRFADVLLVTGPVPKAMHEALKSCYEAMAEPRRVIAVGSCAISGGLHKGGYTEANGVDNVLPVDLYIPGCPPHPWSIIDGIKKVMAGGEGQ